jgi:uncharacterized membrane protein YkgB
MNVALWIGTFVMVPVLGYELQFTAATLSFGRSLSDSNTGTGFQAAITSPWSTMGGLVIYVLTLTLVGISWYEFGIVRALLSATILLVGLSFTRRLFPSPESEHFKALIIRSMGNRYADFVRDGDRVRGDAMKMLLQKAGVDADLLGG